LNRFQAVGAGRLLGRRKLEVEFAKASGSAPVVGLPGEGEEGGGTDQKLDRRREEGSQGGRREERDRGLEE